MIKECLQMGAAVFDFVGGEISISGDFIVLLPCTEPQRTYISLTSNGFLMTRDLYENLGEVGCPAVKQTLYISEYEDVMPCAFTHISFGKLKYESLRDIHNRALKIEKTNRACPLCGSRKNKWVTAGREHEFNNTTHDLFYVVRCWQCHLVYLNPTPTPIFGVRTKHAYHYRGKGKKEKADKKYPLIENKTNFLRSFYLKILFTFFDVVFCC